MIPGTGKYERLLERCAGLEPIPTAVAHPCEKSALAGPLEAGEKGLIRPILVGPEARMRGLEDCRRVARGPRHRACRRRRARPR